MPRSHEEVKANATLRNEAFTRDVPKELIQEENGLVRKVTLMNSRAMIRLKPIYDVADKLATLLAPHVACKKGCNHCCHIRIPINEVEAQYIGSRIGVKPVVPRFTSLKPEKDYGYQTPCTFLENGACSIYEFRPLECRTHANFDIDDETCQLTDINGNQNNSFVPKPIFPPLKYAVDAIVNLSSSQIIADIRDLFPNGLNR